MWRPRAWRIGGIRCGGPGASGSCRQLLAAVAALLGVTGQPESNRGRNFRGPGVVVIVLDACVAADAVASLPTFVDSGSDVGRCYLSTAFIVHGWAIMSLVLRDTGVKGASGPPLAKVRTVEAAERTRRRLWWCCG